MNRAGYSETALAASIAIFLSIMISCMGTHRFTAAVVHKPRVRGTWREKVREVSGTLANRSFLALAIAGIVGAISTGLRQGLDFYISAYFWELTPAQMSYLAAASLFAAFAGVGLAPAISSRFGKKASMIGVFFASLFASIVPITMRLLGLAPANSTTALFTLVFEMRRGPNRNPENRLAHWRNLVPVGWRHPYFLSLNQRVRSSSPRRGTKNNQLLDHPAKRPKSR